MYPREPPRQGLREMANRVRGCSRPAARRCVAARPTGRRPLHSRYGGWFGDTTSGRSVTTGPVTLTYDWSAVAAAAAGNAIQFPPSTRSHLDNSRHKHLAELAHAHGPHKRPGPAHRFDARALELVRRRRSDRWAAADPASSSPATRKADADQHRTGVATRPSGKSRGLGGKIPHQCPTLPAPRDARLVGRCIRPAHQDSSPIEALALARKGLQGMHLRRTSSSSLPVERSCRS